jgi:hypothetical protein
MKTQEYLILSRTSDEIGDKFYRCVSEWVRGCRDQRTSYVCREVGEQYAAALNRQIQYLESLKQDPVCDIAIRRCESYREYLQKSLGLLDTPLNRDH